MNESRQLVVPGHGVRGAVCCIQMTHGLSESWLKWMDNQGDRAGGETELTRHEVSAFSRLVVSDSKNNQRSLEEDVECEDEEGPVGEVDEPLDPVTVRRRPVVRPHAAQHDPRDEVERHDAAVDGVDDRRTSPLQHMAE